MGPATRTGTAGAEGLLIAAHGEAPAGARNDGAAALATALADRHRDVQVGFGLLKGSPSIGDALASIAATRIAVYPLFLADGHFSRTVLRKQLEKAAAGAEKRIELLPPLGLDPALAEIVGAHAATAARQHGFDPIHATLVLLAHGSSKGPASRDATTQLAEWTARPPRFRAVRAAFLEEPPALQEISAATHGPLVVVGLFAGSGLHGAGDVPDAVAALAREDAVFAGNVGAFAELSGLVSAAFERWRKAAATTSAECDHGAQERTRTSTVLPAST